MLSDVSTYLAAQGITCTVILDRMVPRPVNVIMLEDRTNPKPDHTYDRQLIKFMGLTITVRSANYTTAEALMSSVFTALDMAQFTSAGGTRYIKIEAEGSMNRIPVDFAGVGLEQYYTVWIAD